MAAPEEAKKEKVKILMIGFEDLSKELVHSVGMEVDFFDLKNADEFVQFIDSPGQGPFGFLLVGPTIKDFKPTELAQSLRMQFMQTPIFYVTSMRDQFERIEFIKNGFTDSFLIPLDGDLLKKKITEALEFAYKAKKAMRSVKLIDIGANSKVEFDISIYLPANKKYIKYTAAGDTIDAERIDKLKKNKVNNIFVPVDQMKQFYDYTAQQLKTLNTPGGKMSETERKEKLETAVRDLITGMFVTDSSEATIEAGRMMVSDCQEIVNSFIMNNSPGDWYSKISKNIGNATDAYSHSTAVSTFASLFSIGLQMGKPEDLAVAGMFHDLGMSDVPMEVQNKPEEQRSAQEKKLYQMHPEISVKIMKERKLIVPPTVMSAILQHHEKFDGTGFPKQLPGNRISIEAQIVALADRFDYLTREENGKKKVSPYEALEIMMKEPAFNPELVKKLLALTPK